MMQDIQTSYSARATNPSCGAVDDRPDDRIRWLRFRADGRSIELLVGAGVASDSSGADRAAVVLANGALFEAVLEEEGRLGRHSFAAAMAAVGRDAVIESLTRALVLAAAAAGPRDDASLDSIGTALVIRAVALCRVRGEVLARAAARAALAKWRLTRVVEHVDAHLGERVTLAEMAKVAGLTRMHFAAQFRRATGTSPHGYLVQRRIERSKELLKDGSRPLADIALGVGFGTQSHFTTTFKRLVGQTPHRWRQAATRTEG